MRKGKVFLFAEDASSKNTMDVFNRITCEDWDEITGIMTDCNRVRVTQRISYSLNLEEPTDLKR